MPVSATSMRSTTKRGSASTQSTLVMMLPRSAVCADRVMEVLGTETSVAPPAEPVTDLPLRGTLELDHVELTVSAVGGQVTVEVQDDGRGMAADLDGHWLGNLRRRAENRQ